jgi:hypothetical protein
MGDQDFSEATKKEVREKAGFQCCRCHNIGVQVHHIIPQEHGGSNDIDNAAPLCPRCHDYFGANPVKRKEIKQMRDWWYQRIEMMYPDNRQKAGLEDINNKLDKVLQRQISPDDLKHVLFIYNQESYNRNNEMISNMTLGTAVVTASAIVNASGSVSSSSSSSLYPSSASPSYPSSSSSSSALSPSEPKDDSPS